MLESKNLQKHTLHLQELSLAKLLEDNQRNNQLYLSTEPISADFSRNFIDETSLQLFEKFFNSENTQARLQGLLNGEHINTTEDRAALHLLLRRSSSEGLSDKTIKLFHEKQKESEKRDQFVRQLYLRPENGLPAITDIVHVGTGGSYNGSHFLLDTFKNLQLHNSPAFHLITKPDETLVQSILERTSVDSTLFIFSSKSFGTSEIITILDQLFAHFNEDNLTEKFQDHCYAVTMNSSKAVSKGIPEENIFNMWDSIGGRFSIWSSIGLPVQIAIGTEKFNQFLQGAEEIDNHFLSTPFRSNIPMMMAAVDFINFSILKASAHSVIPYSQRLTLFPEYLQQLEMESNGKSATLDGNISSVDTQPVLFGYAGTDAQHSFFQLLHQGTGPVPVDFIGISPSAENTNITDINNHHYLFSNLLANASVLTYGKDDPDIHKKMPGNKPSSILLLNHFTPASVGALIALYEHKVFANSLLWNINPFDQFGVELGKTIAREIFQKIKIHDTESIDPHLRFIVNKYLNSGKKP